jgi:hypothetical protein
MNLLHAIFTRNLLMSGVAIVRCIPRALRVTQVDGISSSRRRSGRSIAVVQRM